jgi:hypothetical protein
MCHLPKFGSFIKWNYWSWKACFVVIWFVIGQQSHSQWTSYAIAYVDQTSFWKIEKILSNKHKDTLDLLKRYFSKRNIIDNVRNNYAFHYTPDGLRAALPNINEDLLLYIEESGKGNNLNYFAEVIANRALLQSIEKEDEFEAFKQLAKETINISELLLKASEGIMEAFLRRYKKDIWEGNAEEVYFDKLPSFGDICIPWFTDNDMLLYGLTEEEIKIVEGK